MKYKIVGIGPGDAYNTLGHKKELLGRIVELGDGKFIDSGSYFSGYVHLVDGTTFDDEKRICFYRVVLAQTNGEVSWVIGDVPGNPGYFAVTDGKSTKFAYYSTEKGWYIFKKEESIPLNSIDFRIKSFCPAGYTTPIPTFDLETKGE